MSALPATVPPLETAFDFRNPPAGPAGNRVADWLSEVCRAAPKQWAASLGGRASLRLVRVDQVRPGDILGSLPESSLGIVLDSTGHPLGPVFLSVTRPALLALLAGLFGEPLAAAPADRDVSAVEAALLDFVFQLLLLPLRTPEAGTNPLPLAVKTVGPARANCPLSPTELAVGATLDLILPFGSEPLSLLFPLAGLEKPEAAPAAAENRFDRAPVEALMAEMALGFSVDLGRTRLTVGQFAALTVGDVLVLDQRITDPLRARIEDRDKFDVWPGAIGSSQAVCVHGTRRTKAS